jgi:circadian clock protein KaiC
LSREEPAGAISTGIPSLDRMLGGGYPENSAVVVNGAPGIGKEALGYWFMQCGLTQNDFTLYVTRLSSREVLRNARAFGVDFSQRIPFWFSREGGLVKFEANDLASLSFNIKEILKKNSDRKIRIVTDVISTLLMLNPAETIYKFLSQLFADLKQYDAVLLATLEDGMHPPNVLAAMEQLFDGVIELRMYEEGLRVLPLLRIKKMSGIPPLPDYYDFSFSKNGMEVKANGK